MKFTILLLIAGLCLATVSANGGAFEQSEEDFEYRPQEFADDIMDTDEQSATLFFGLYFVIKGALRTVKGINCTIKEVVATKNAAQTFLNAIQACGGEVSQQVQNVINACTAIISTCNDIINLNESTCPKNETTGKTPTPWNCFWKLLGKTMTLKRQVKNAINLIKKVPTIGTGASDCATTAVNNLSLTFTQFPANVKSCSKLTS